MIKNGLATFKGPMGDLDIIKCRYTGHLFALLIQVTLQPNVEATLAFVPLRTTIWSAQTAMKEMEKDLN